MRIAIFSDVHGNLIALDAVLADIERRGGVDGYWVLGDLSALGYAPSQVLKRLAHLSNALFVRGNGDRYVAHGQYPAPSIEAAQRNPELVPTLAEVRASFGWTAGHLVGSGWMDWLKALPLSHELTLPDGTTVQLVHATPDSDHGDGLHPALTDQALRPFLQDCTARLLCVGHVHVPMKRTLDSITIVNPGCVSNPLLPGTWASYAILHADETRYHIDFHRVAYDHESVIEELYACGIPCADFVAQWIRGELRADWQDVWDGVTYLPEIIS